MRQLLFIFLIFILLVGCHAKSGISEDVSVFPVPYFPENRSELLGLPISFYSENWVSGCIYTENIMNKKQIAFIKNSPKMQNEGRWGTFFREDFDHDGYFETVNYGAFRNKYDTVGNFLLVTRNKEKDTEIVLVHEFLDTKGAFSYFYLTNSDKSIMFGGGLRASEFTWLIKWTEGGPILVDLSSDE
jgi:hypothetical protein